jgi:hypothetical protein
MKLKNEDIFIGTIKALAIYAALLAVVFFVSNLAQWWR